VFPLTLLHMTSKAARGLLSRLRSEDMNIQIICHLYHPPFSLCHIREAFNNLHHSVSVRV
jgi:hypothetical protein